MKAEDDEWPVSFEANRRAQARKVALETTPAQRLEWLEEARRFALRARELGRATKTSKD